MTLLLFVISWLRNRFGSTLGRVAASPTVVNGNFSPVPAPRRQPTGKIPTPPTSAFQIQVNQTVTDYKQIADNTAQKSIVDAGNGIPKDGKTLAPAEKTLRDARDRGHESLIEIGKAHNAEIEHQLKPLRQKLGDGSIEKRIILQSSARRQARRKKAVEGLPGATLSPQLRRLLRRYRNVESLIARLKETLRQQRDVKAIADNHYHQLKQNRYAGIPPIKGLMDRSWLFWSLVTVLLWVEILANFSSFQSLGLGDNNLAALSLAGFFAVFLAFSAKGLGFALRDGNRVQGWLYGGFCLILCLIISGSRLSMEADAATKGIYLLVNFLITGATVLVAWYYARHHAFFTAKSQRDRFSHRIAHTEHQIEELTGAMQAEELSTEESMELEQQQLIDEETRKLEAQIYLLEAELQRTNSIVTSGVRELDKHYTNAVNSYRATNNTIRQENGYPAITEWFTTGSGPLGRVAILLLGLGLGLTSCGDPAPPPAHVEVLYDVTSGEHKADVESMSAFILDQLEQELEAENRNEITVTLSAIDETSTTSLHTVSLPASKDFMSRNQKQHEREPERFREELNAALTELTQPGEGKHKSAIHRNLVNRAQALVKQPGRKLILCWSDLILNEPPVSFYDYQRTPEKIGRYRDTLLAQLTRRYDLPDLNGVTLINTYQPVLAEDDIHEEAKAFFRHYWHDVKGAEVVFQTNLSLPTAGTALSQR